MGSSPSGPANGVMEMRNPLAQLRGECRRILDDALSQLHPEAETAGARFSYPPEPEMGELSTPICFQLAKVLGEKPTDIADGIVAEIDVGASPLVALAEAVNGYINFHADTGNFARLVLETAVEEDEEYGFLKADSPERVMVEHTSANPNGPIHIGNARNSILGDSLAQMLRRRGHDVQVHFLVNDMGRQVAMAAYGWRLLGMPEPDGRPDLWVGTIYASVNVLKEIKRLKAELERVEASDDLQRISVINRELSRYAAAAQELRERSPRIFDTLLEKIEADPDPESSIARLNAQYEAEQPEAKRIVRSLVQHCLRGFEESLGEIGIHFDMWDYESDLVWSKAADEVLNDLKATPYTFYEEGALILDCDRIAVDLGLKERWGLNPSHEIPRLVLVRSDGTTLYTLRDVAYSLWKFQRVDRVINVIGYEQTLAQLQLRVALAALGEVEMGDRQRHYAYEFVRLPGAKMSGRLGRYVTLSEVIERSTSLAYDEVTERSPQLPEDQRREIARMVGYGAVKYALLSVDPMKVVVFDWGKALNFEMNSAPFIQYSHARACNILKRAAERPEAGYGLLRDRRERDLVMRVARFPEVFEAAVEELKPGDISAYANTLADRFNSFYAALPVLKADPRELAGARLMLVDAVRIVLRNALSLLGIRAPERM
ncbi:MAG: arginine--tRNA ligase [Candidatus Bathyarchaeia archaeon]